MLRSTTVSGVSFHEYVRRVAEATYGETADANIGVRLRTTGNTVGSWKTSEPSFRYVREFALKYKRPIAEVLHYAYGLTPEDLGHEDPSPYVLSDAALIAALVNRMGVPVDELYELLGETHPSSDRLSRQDASRRKP